MFGTWLDAAVGALWGVWLAVYLDRFYGRQVAAVTLCVFVFWGKSFKANRYLASAINVVLVGTFLLLASGFFGSWVTGWGAFIAGWCFGYAVYTLQFAQAKHSGGTKA